MILIRVTNSWPAALEMLALSLLRDDAMNGIKQCSTSRVHFLSCLMMWPWFGLKHHSGEWQTKECQASQTKRSCLDKDKSNNGEKCLQQLAHASWQEKATMMPTDRRLMRLTHCSPCGNLSANSCFDWQKTRKVTPTLTDVFLIRLTHNNPHDNL